MKGDPKPKKMISWSYSAWSTWKGCAYKYYRGYVLGIREPPNHAMARGIEVHRLQEFYLKGEINSLPKVFTPFMGPLKALKKAKPVVEQYWGVDDHFKYHQGSKDDRSWCVMKMDAAVEPEKMGGWVFVQDLKTGREYDNHFDQAELYAAISTAKYKKAKGVIAEFWYVDQGHSTQIRFPKKYLLKRQNYWLDQGAQLLNPKQKFLPKPNEWGCKYCFHRDDRKGDCSAWRTLPMWRRL